MKKQKIKITERPPIIVIMGHVDHGKSALLDYIRKSNVVDNEAGSITQHVSAYEVEHKAKGSRKTKRITFLDTPGHAAFSQMRSRGATIADIAILVVSAEDGVKKQTKEALAAIVEAKIPYIVAINKIDKPGADVEKTKSSLIENEIYIEGMGGDIPYILISAKKGTGVPELLDMMLLVAEVEELEANAALLGEGTVIESHVDPQKGIASSLIITNGTLKSGMHVVSGTSSAPVRVFEDFLGKSIKEATFSSPVRIIGWDSIPSTGDTFLSFEKKKDAEKYLAEIEANKEIVPAEPLVFTLPDPNAIHTTIPIIVKADVSGTLEAVEEELNKIDMERITLKLVKSGVGAVSENDVKMLIANMSEQPIILTFNTKIDSRAARIADQNDIPIQSFDVIYKMSEWLEEEVARRQPRIEIAEVSGVVKVIRIFSIQKHLQVIGGKVKEGFISMSSKVNIMRRGNLIGEGKVVELQQQKLPAEKVEEGYEFGVRIDSRYEIAEGDTLEVITMVTK